MINIKPQRQTYTHQHEHLTTQLRTRPVPVVDEHADPHSRMSLACSWRRTQNHDMADLTVTSYGSLGDDLARAVQQIIAMTSRASLIALNDVHLRLAIDYCTSGTAPPPEPPLHRWLALIDSLFGASPDRAGPLTTSAPDPDETRDQLAKASLAEQQTIVQLVIATGTFLVAEAVALDEQVQLAMTVDPSRPALADDQPDITANLDKVVAAGRLLLDHAEPAMLAALLVGDDNVRTLPRSAGTIEATGAAYCQPVSTVLSRRTVGAGAHTGPLLIAIVVDTTCGVVSLRGLIPAALGTVEKGLLSDRWVDSRGVNVVVTDVDGRLSAEVPLIAAQTTNHTDDAYLQCVDVAVTRVKDLLLALAPLPSSEGIVDQPPWVDELTERSWKEYQLTRWEAIAEALDFVATTLEAARIVVVTDAFPSPGPLTGKKQGASARPLLAAGNAVVPPAAVIERLRQQDLVPRLTRRAITVVYASSVAGRRLREHWHELCTLAGVSPCDLDILIPGLGMRTQDQKQAGSNEMTPPPARPNASMGRPPDAGLPPSVSDQDSEYRTKPESERGSPIITSYDERWPYLHNVLIAAAGLVCAALVVIAAFPTSTYLDPVSPSIIALILIYSGWVIGRYARVRPENFWIRFAARLLCLIRQLRWGQLAGRNTSTGSWPNSPTTAPASTQSHTEARCV